jgi:hypothetical protein
MPQEMSVAADPDAALRSHAVRIVEANQRLRGCFVEWIGTVGAELKAAQEELAGNHDGFIRWAKAEFGWSKSRTYQLVQASDIVARVSTSVDDPARLPSNESQCRALAAVAPRKQAKVWLQAVEAAEERGGEPTASLIRRYSLQAKDKTATTAPADPDAMLGKAKALLRKYLAAVPDGIGDVGTLIDELLAENRSGTITVIDAVPADAAVEEAVA